MGMTAVFRVVSDAEARAWIADGEEAGDVLGDLYGDERTDLLDVDKAWHGLHWLLSGSAEPTEDPLGFIMGGAEVGQDISYGPARAYTADEVRKIAAALAPIEAAELRSRFDGDAMSADGIYPDIWQRDPAEDDTLGYLVTFYEPLKQLIAGAAQAGNGLVTAIL